MDDLKEEILAAVAQAIAGLRREHVAETEALRAEASELRRELNDMRAQKDAAEREAEDKFQQLMEVSKRLTEAGDATIELVAASRKELDDALAAVRADVSTKAPAEDLVAVWDSLTDYAQCPDVAKSIGAVNELVQEVRSSTLRDRDEVLGEIAALPDADALFAEAREQMDILHRAALAKVDDAVALFVTAAYPSYRHTSLVIPSTLSGLCFQ